MPRTTRRLLARLALALAVAATLASPAVAAPGDLDPTFDGDGIASFQLGTLSRSEYGYRMARQGDGKLVVVGTAESASTGSDTLVMRFEADGTPDATFDGDGARLLSLSADNDQAAAVLVQGAKLLVAGRLDSGGPSGTDAFVLRLNADGSTDSTFGGGDGIVTFAAAPASAVVDAAQDLALDAGGSIVVAGHGVVAGRGSEALVARLSADGVLDPTFDGDGIAVVSFGTTDDGANAVAIQPSNGRIVVAGWRDVNATIDFDWAVARLTTAGAPDASFDGDGFLTLDVGAGAPLVIDEDLANDVLITPTTETILVVGQSGDAEDNSDVALARFTAAGALDPAFDGDGRVDTSIPCSRSDCRASGTAGAILGDGRIVVAGSTDVSDANLSDLVALRYSSTGAPDASFDGDGRASVSVDGEFSRDQGYDLVHQPDGTLVVAGVAFPSDLARSDVLVVRLTDEGALDPGFSGDGKATAGLEPLPRRDQLHAVVALPGGKVLASGRAPVAGIGEEPMLVRLTGDGSLDPGFAGSGVLRVPVIADGTVRLGLALDAASGRATISGTAIAPNGLRRVLLARADPTGALDASFAGAGIATLAFGQALAADEGHAVALDGARTVVVGWLDGSALLVARVGADGTPDASFDGDGLASVGGAGNTIGRAIAVRPDHRIVVAASTPGASSNVQVVQLTEGGALDPSFGGGDGIADLTLSAGQDEDVSAIALQPDGKIVLVGWVDVSGMLSGDWVVARLNADGSPDATFDGDGIRQLAFGAASQQEEAYGLALQPDGRIVVAGSTRVGGTAGVGILRLLADGSSDPGFSGDGVATTPVGGATPEAAYGLALGDGTATVVGETDFADSLALRYLVDGAVGPVSPPGPAPPAPAPPAPAPAPPAPAPSGPLTPPAGGTVQVADVPATADVSYDPRTKRFVVRVRYRIREGVACPRKGCAARLELRTRTGKRLYAGGLKGDGKLVLGTRKGVTIPTGTRVRIDLPVARSALLKAPFARKGGVLVVETRLRVRLTTTAGEVLTVRDGAIRISVARIQSGALPGLTGIKGL